MEIAGPTPNLTRTEVIGGDGSPRHCAIRAYDGHRRGNWRITFAGETPEAG